MSVRCVECARLTLRDHPNMARRGFGNCEIYEKWIFVSAHWERECGYFNPADEEVIEKREEWFANQKWGRA